MLKEYECDLCGRKPALDGDMDIGTERWKYISVDSVMLLLCGNCGDERLQSGKLYGLTSQELSDAIKKAAASKKKKALPSPGCIPGEMEIRKIF